MEKQQNIDITNFPDFTCPNCKSKLLREAVVVKEIPKFVIGNSETAYAPAPVIVCSECNEVLFSVPAQTALVSPFKPFL